jgi:CubicO group peptidase (beta-lactamase class C family)
LKISIIIFSLVLVFAKKVSGQTIVSKIDSVVLEALNQKAFNGNILIAKNGNGIYEKCAWFADIKNQIPSNINTQFQIASVSKQFTAFGIMVLKRDGKLNYDDFVTKYISDFPYSNITLRHLLNHTSDLPNFWKDIRPNLDTTKSNGNKEMIAYLINKKLPLQFEPGDKLEYADIGYDILATIIEKISGMSYQKFMYKKVFKPVGLKNTKALMVIDFRRMNTKQLATGYIEDSIKGNTKPHEVKNFVFYLSNFYADD